MAKQSSPAPATQTVEVQGTTTTDQTNAVEAQEITLQSQLLAMTPHTKVSALKLVEDCQALTINGVDDEQGYEKVKRNYLDIRKFINAVDKKRKDLNEDAQKEIKTRNEVAKEITGWVSPAELHLKAEMDRIDNKKIKIIREENEKKAKKRQERIDQLKAVGMVSDEENWIQDGTPWGLERRVLPAGNIADMSDEDWAITIEGAEDCWVEIQQAKTAQEKKQKQQEEENERLRRELEETKRKLAEVPVVKPAPAAEPEEELKPLKMTEANPEPANAEQPSGSGLSPNFWSRASQRSELERIFVNCADPFKKLSEVAIDDDIKKACDDAVTSLRDVYKTFLKSNKKK